MKMASRCLASFHKYCSMRFQVSPENLIQPLNISQPGQPIRLATALSLRGFGLETPTAKVNCVRLIHSSCRHEAGHSKWHNIRHIKAAFDKEKSEKSGLLSRKLQIILDRNPETDPKLNTELANLIKWARSNNLTKDVVDNAIDRQIKRRDPNNVTAFAGRGPSNTGIVIECFSLKAVHTKSVLQNLVKKAGFNLHVPADDLFDHKGVLEVELSKEETAAAKADPENFPLDKYIEIAINAGAEEVTLENDGEKPYLQFLCGPQDVPKVSKSLGDAGLNVVSSERNYIPKKIVPVTEEFIESVRKLADKLDLNSDVIKYYFNVESES